MQKGLTSEIPGLACENLVLRITGTECKAHCRSKLVAAKGAFKIDGVIRNGKVGYVTHPKGGCIVAGSSPASITKKSLTGCNPSGLDYITNHFQHSKSMQTATLMQLTERHSFDFDEHRSLIFFEDRYGFWMLPATKGDIENYIRQNGEEGIDFTWTHAREYDKEARCIEIRPWAVIAEGKLEEWLPAYVEANVQQQEEVEE